ncbi:hypothetical protein GCM10023178_67190 [Actinomadura luteofluorescens]
MSSSRLLFDEPGPRARRRIRIATALTLLGGAALRLASYAIGMDRLHENDMSTAKGRAS